MAYVLSFGFAGSSSTLVAVSESPLGDPVDAQFERRQQRLESLDATFPEQVRPLARDAQSLLSASDPRLTPDASPADGQVNGIPVLLRNARRRLAGHLTRAARPGR